jgi:hypothetical protein
MTVLAPIADNRVFTALTDLATCLCATLVTEGLPDVCFCGVVPGEAASAMYGGDCAKRCGMAWVRLVSVSPTNTLGDQAPATQPGNCASGIGSTVEVGVLRCTPIGTAERPPSDADLLSAARLQIADMMAMRQAVACCVGSRDWVLGTYTPAGPSGGLLGGLWTVQMWSP